MLSLFSVEPSFWGIFKGFGAFSKPSSDNFYLEPADRPSFFDAKGRMKYEAWAQLGDMPKDVAMKT